MAQPLTTATGTTDNRSIVDLDAGTTLPRIARIVLVTLLIGAFALLAIAAAPNRKAGASTPSTFPPAALTVPALRSTWSATTGPLGPELPIGPVPGAIDLARLTFAAGNQRLPLTETIHDRN